MTKDGRKFETWTYRKDGFEKGVEIRVRGRGQYTEFFARVEDLGVDIKSKVAAEIPERLQAEFDKLFAIEWRLKLRVSVKEQSFFNDNGSGFSLDWVAYREGVTPDGRTVHGQVSLDYDYPDGGPRQLAPLRDGWMDHGHSRISDGPLEALRHAGDGDTSAVIDGTPENLEALFRVEWMLKVAEQNLKRMFEQGNIEKTLKLALSGAPLALTEGQSNEDK